MMIPKKVDGKQPPRSYLSPASRLLGDAVRAILPLPQPEEPWRQKARKAKNGSKKRK
jgi:hypothetical protein